MRTPGPPTEHENWAQRSGRNPRRGRPQIRAGQGRGVGEFSPPLLIVVGWFVGPSPSLAPSTAHPQHVHSMLMLPTLAGSYSVALWVRRRFTTSCVASRSPPMPRPPGLTRNGPVILGSTACSPTGRVRWRRSGHQRQKLTSPSISTISGAHTRQRPVVVITGTKKVDYSPSTARQRGVPRRVSQQTASNGPPWGGDRE